MHPRDAPHYRPLWVIAERVLQPLEVDVAAIRPPAAVALGHIEVELRVVVASSSARVLVVVRAAERALFRADRAAELAVARVACRLRAVAVLLAARALAAPVRLLAAQVLVLAELDVRIEAFEGALVIFVCLLLASDIGLVRFEEARIRVLLACWTPESCVGHVVFVCFLLAFLVRVHLSRQPPVRHVARVARRVHLQVVAVRLPVDGLIVAAATVPVVVGRRSGGPTALAVVGRGVSATLVGAAVVGVALAAAA